LHAHLAAAALLAYMHIQLLLLLLLHGWLV
jgi:hypothetical protein